MFWVVVDHSGFWLFHYFIISWVVADLCGVFRVVVDCYVLLRVVPCSSRYDLLVSKSFSKQQNMTFTYRIHSLKLTKISDLIWERLDLKDLISILPWIYWLRKCTGYILFIVICSQCTVELNGPLCFFLKSILPAGSCMFKKIE